MYVLLFALCWGVQAPVLAIVASDGPFFDKLNALKSGYQQLSVRQVTGGHHCHMTAASQVARLIDAWR